MLKKKNKYHYKNALKVGTLIYAGQLMKAQTWEESIAEVALVDNDKNEDKDLSYCDIYAVS